MIHAFSCSHCSHTTSTPQTFTDSSWFFDLENMEKKKCQHSLKPFLKCRICKSRRRSALTYELLLKAWQASQLQLWNGTGQGLRGEKKYMYRYIYQLNIRYFLNYLIFKLLNVKVFSYRQKYLSLSFQPMTSMWCISGKCEYQCVNVLLPGKQAEVSEIPFINPQRAQNTWSVLH